MLKYVKLLGLVPVVIALLVLAYYLMMGVSSHIESEVRLDGYLIASDAGMPGGGFEWVGEYILKLVYKENGGYLRIEQVSGLGDPLENRVLEIDRLEIGEERMILVIEGYTYIFEFIEVDPIWNRFNNTYTAIYSPYDERFEVGIIDNDAFEGFPDHYYIEIHFWRPDK